MMRMHGDADDHGQGSHDEGEASHCMGLHVCSLNVSGLVFGGLRFMMSESNRVLYRPIDERQPLGQPSRQKTNKPPPLFGSRVVRIDGENELFGNEAHRSTTSERAR